MKTPGRWLLAPLAVVLVLAVACGGDGGGAASSGISEEEGREAMERFVQTSLNLFAGKSSAQDVINLYAPECRKGVDASKVDAVVSLIKLFAPAFGDAQIEDVDVGKLSFAGTSKGLEVSVVDPNALRLKVKGKFLSADEYFASLGMDRTTGEDEFLEGGTFLVVKRDGKVYAGDCSDLQDFAG